MGENTNFYVFLVLLTLLGALVAAYANAMQNIFNALEKKENADIALYKEMSKARIALEARKRKKNLDEKKEIP